MKKISVIIPYKDEAKYIKDCVSTIPESAEIEILLVADGGKETVPQWVFEDQRISVILPEEGKGGVAACRNLGIQKARGEYVYFLDADDYVAEPALSALMEAAGEERLLLTGPVAYSWYSPINYTPDRIQWENEELVQEEKEAYPMTEKDWEKRFATLISARHMMIKRSFLLENQICFSEDEIWHTDVGFMMEVLSGAYEKSYMVPQALYVSRYRNDPVHFPSLTQQENKESVQDYKVQYEAGKKAAGNIPVLQEILHHTLIHYVSEHFHHILTLEEVKNFAPLLREIPDFSEKIDTYSFWKKKTLKAIRKNKAGLALRFDQMNTLMVKKQGRFGSKVQWYRIPEHFIFKKLPVKKNWILFESFFGKSYSDSPKYLYEYLQNTYGDEYRYIWILNGKSESLEKTGKHTVCKMNSLRYMYYTARCGYRIFNVRQAGWCKKRPGVVFLETWHGTPLKKLAFDLDDLFSTNQRLKQVFYEQGKEWDYLTSANPFSTETFSRCFGVEKEKILEYGYPRNDILYAENKDEIAVQVKKELGIPEGKRVILYAPTWRDNQMYRRGEYKFTLAMDLDRMQKEFGADSVILLRTHYYIADMLDFSQYEGFVFNASQYEDVSRLYLASDLCITDYSSVFFDYANLKRPLLFFAYDYDAYADEIRGLYIDMEKELPGPILRTNEELVHALHHMDEIEEQYKQRYAEFYDRFCCVDDGHACERTVNTMFKKE